MRHKNFKEKIRQLYTLAAELEAMFPGRKFTPDGHLVGSIGEAIANIDYGVELFPHSHPVTDGMVNGREIQIKATHGKSVAVKKPKQDDLLLVIKIVSDGSWEKVYDGDSERVWNSLISQRESHLRVKTISLNRLRELQYEVAKKNRVVGLGL